MKLANKALVILTAASLFCAAGCKKNDNTDSKNTNDTVVEKVALVNAPSTPWVKEDVNSLLTYIPEDTAMVFASTRQFDIDSPLIKEQLKKSLEYFDNSIKESEKKLMEKADAPENTANAKKFIESIKSMRSIIADFEKTAPEWGINPKGHEDGVLYTVDKTLVYKMTTTDSSKFIEKLTSLFGMLFNNPLIGIAPDVSEIKASSSTWKTYNFKKYIESDIPSECVMCWDGKTVLNDTIAINGDNNIVTIAFVNEGDTAILDKLLKPAEKPLNKAALGSIKDQTQALGYFDNIKLFNVIAHSDMARILEDEELLGEKLSPACEKDITNIIALFPKYSVNIELHDESVTTINSTLDFSMKGELKAIQDLTVSHITLGTRQSLATLAFNINLKKSIDWLNQLAERMDTVKFECEKLNSIFPNSLKSDINELNNQEYQLFTSSVTGFNVAIDKFKPTKEHKFEIETIFNLSGPTLGSAFPLLTSLLGMASPQIAKLMDLKKGEVIEKDLTELVGMPLKLNALLSDTGLVVGTPTYDVKTISNSERKNDGSIFSFSIDMAFLAALGLDTDDLNSNGKGRFEVGVNSDGFTFNVDIMQ